MKTILKGVFVCLLAFAFNAAATTPIITSQPQSVVVNNASAANFSVVATNAASYQWLFGTNNLEGETNATLNVDDVATNSEGFYSVVVTSPTGETTNSQPAQLAVIPGTIIRWTLSTYGDGSSSNFLVQLFDHDKPATVENFIHYITSGAYSNTFIDRDAANFVIQGGDYTANDRSTNQLNGNNVSGGTNSFPAQLENEYGYGPLIHNRFGTLAMGLKSGETNSATSAFFFNTTNNSASLDAQDFVVFGRILTGSNILQYFNNLTAPTNGIYPLSFNIQTLPVNFAGTNAPTDANLFFCDFSFVTPAPVDTNPPRLLITYPSPNAAIASGSPVTISGMASDNVGLAEVYGILTPLSGAGANQSQTNYAVGTTSWSIGLGTLAPGAYEVTAYSEDGMGNLSPGKTVFFTNMVQLTIVTNAGGQLTSNTFLYLPGGQFSVTAEPGTGEIFESWENQGVVSVDPVQTFTAETNFTLTLNLIANTLPAGLAITSPANGATVHATNSGDITITGTLPTSAFISDVTCQLFYQSNAVSTAEPATLQGSSWFFAVSNLVSGSYSVLVIATDSSGRQGFVTGTFTAVVTAPTITSQPSSQTVNAGSTASFSVTGANVVSYQWRVGGNNIPGATNSTLTLEDLTTNQAGAYTVVLTSSTGDSRFSQPAQLTVLQGTIVQLALSGYADGGVSNVTVELFDHDKPATVQNFLHYVVSGAYSNLFWTRCVPGSILQAGDYSAQERTKGAPPHLNSILSTFTQNLGYTPPFPFQVDNEFAVGPLIHNTFGTISMQKTPGEPDSATSTFFFNLADNSSTLDNQDGGSAVFGRIISGSEVLSFFNTLNLPTINTRINASAGPTNGLFDSGSEPFSFLPVNYYGVRTPGDSNLIYVDLSLPTPPTLDTNLPTVSLTYPTLSNPVTNRQVTMTGTATDDVGIARVVASITSPQSLSGEAIGTSNWSFNFGNLPPGTNTVYLVAQDGAGNLSTPLQTSFTMPQYPVSVSTNGPGVLSTNLNIATTTFGKTYVVKAIPSKGALFAGWSENGVELISPTMSLTMPNGLQLTASFIPNTMPGGISFTYPPANGNVAATNFALTGKISKSAGQTTVTARIFSKTNSEAVTDPLTTAGIQTWSIPSVQLAPGDYIVQAIASNTLGQTTVITEDFTVLAPLKVKIAGPGSTSIADGTYLEVGKNYTIRATAKTGGSFYAWNGAGGLVTEPAITFTMVTGASFSVTFITNSIPKTLSFTYPVANSVLTTNGFTMTGNVSASVVNPQVLCQLFLGSAQAGGLQYATVNGSSWSLPFTGLQQGNYTVVAIASDSSGEQTVASENFKLNFFPAIAGTYYGVFFATNIATNNAGFYKLTVNNSGLMTGKLQFPIATFTIAFPLNPAGNASLAGTGFGGTTLYLGVNFDLTNGTDSVSGYVDSVGTLAQFTGYKAVTQLPTNTVAGKYLLDLETVTNQGPSDPTNDGFAALSIGKTGALTLSGTLADNTTFSEGVGISKAGVWPVFAPLYKGHGMLIGWETNVIGSSGSPGTTGTVYWVKAPTKDTYFTNGLNLEASGFGTNYVTPVPGSQYQVVFGGGTLNPPLTNTLTVSPARQFVPAAGSSDKLAMSLSTAGVITGKLLNPADNATLQIHGVFGNPAVGGSGFVLDSSGRSDSFVITPLP